MSQLITRTDCSGCRPGRALCVCRLIRCVARTWSRPGDRTVVLDQVPIAIDRVPAAARAKADHNEDNGNNEAEEGPPCLWCEPSPTVPEAPEVPEIPVA